MADDDEVPELIEPGLTSISGGTAPLAVNHRVPCTLICGFLGAGKSTLLKRILTEKHGYRIAVIVNEFGDTADIEARAINVSSADNPDVLAEDVLELANGCLCCSIKDLGVAAIEKLMMRKGAFDHILLETTGLADPGPIASIFWQNEEFATGLGRDICLDGVVCVVDGVFGEQQLAEDHASDGVGESLRQIACADVILLNKMDLVTNDSTVESAIRAINPVAPIHKTVKCQIDLKYVIGLDAYTARPVIQEQTSSNEAHNHDHDSPTHTQCEISGRHGAVSSLRVTCQVLTAEQIQKLDEWIRTVLWDGHLPGNTDHKVEVLRCKGAFRADDGLQYVLQGVRSLYEISEVRGEVDAGDPTTGKLVFIGRGLTDAARSSLVSTLD